jgi:RNA polymerase sigma-70 factor, ECF subfamily
MGDCTLALNSGLVADPGRPHLSRRDDRMRAVVKAHFVFIGRMLFRFGVPRSDLDDAVQQVFIAMSAKLHEIVPTSERSFLFGTALRVAAACRRSARRRDELDVEALACYPDDRPRPDELLATRQRLEVLDRIVCKMTDELRAVFILCEIEEHTVAEAAALRRIPMGTAASRLRRARRELERRSKHLREQRRQELRAVSTNAAASDQRE